MIIEFHHGPLADDYETQANRQGFTFGNNTEFVNKVGFGIVAAYLSKEKLLTDDYKDEFVKI